MARHFRPETNSIARARRVALLTGAAVIIRTVPVLTLGTALPLAVALTTPAMADGGAGGSVVDIISGTSVAGGSGGADGQPGDNGGPGINPAPTSGGGGGGGGAGGGAGGTGGAGLMGAAGGAAGQNGDDASIFGDGGGGGGGGNGGVHGQTINADTTIGSAVSGSAGGNGGNGGSASGQAFDGGGGGGGGAGGHGAVISGGTNITNNSSIAGGAGGSGGDGGDGNPVPPPGFQYTIGGNGGTGGAGGIGVNATGNGITLTNNGTIAGGAGGTGGSGGTSFTVPNGANGTNGPGGAGVVGAGLTVIQGAGGTISGGIGLGGRADAISFTGGANNLIFQGATSGLTGNIGLYNSAILTFLQNNGTNATVANTITGNGSVLKDGANTIALSSANTYSGGTSINAGVLQIENMSALGTGTVSLAGGTLRSTVSGTFGNAWQFMSGTSTFSVAAGQTVTTTFAPSFGAGANAHFGSAIDTGTIIIGQGGSSAGIVANSNLFIDGGTVRAGNFFLAAATDFNNNTTVAAGATLDYNDQQHFGFAKINKLFGAGTVLTGTNAATNLRITNGDFSGGIQGAGNLIVTDTLLLSGTGLNTYGGTTTVDTGATLRGGATNAFNATSATTVSGTLDLNNFNQTIGSLAGAGNVTLGTATLTAGGNNATTTFSGAMTGTGGFAKQGTGVQAFAGTLAYFGATTVNAGTLAVNGSLTNSDTTVNASGLLAGTGQVRNVTVNGGGGFAPGSLVPGTQMTVNGNLTFNGGLYGVVIDPAATSSAVVTGTASLTGANVFATFHAGSYVARQYLILQAAALAGTFDALLTNQLPTGFGAALSYLGNDVYLNLTAQLGVGGGHLTVNQQNVATSLNNYFNNGGTLPPGFASLFGLTGDALRSALNQASGEPGASISQSTFLAWNQFFNMMFDPFAGGRSGMNGQGMSGPGALPFAAEANAESENVRLAYAAVSPKGDLKSGIVTKAVRLVSNVYQPRWSIWGGGYGGTARTDGNATIGSHDTTSRAYGFVAGADHRLTPDTLIGFALAGGGTSFGLAQGLGGGSSDLFQASVYARQNWGAAYLMGAAGYGWQDFTLNRTVTIAGNDKLEADFNANTFAGRAEGGWRFGNAWTGMTPYAAVQIASIRLPGYSEHATSGADTFALAYSGRTDTQTRSEFGARFDHAMPVQDGLVTLRGRAAWARDYDDNNVANAAFMTLPGAAFIVNGAQPDEDSLLLSAGAELAFRNGFSLAGSFEGEFSGNTESYAGKGAIRYRW